MTNDWLAAAVNSSRTVPGSPAATSNAEPSVSFAGPSASADSPAGAESVSSALYTTAPRLLELMVDTVVGEFAYPEPRPEHWRDALTALARQDWRSFFAHPWLLAVTATSRPPMGPNMLTAMEWALASFDGLDLAAHEQLYLLTTVISYTQGLALTWNRQEPEDTTDWWREQVAEAGGHPRLLAVTEGYRHPALDLDEEFEFGLERVLDGIAVYLDKR